MEISYFFSELCKKDVLFMNTVKMVEIIWYEKHPFILFSNDGEK